MPPLLGFESRSVKPELPGADAATGTVLLAGDELHGRVAAIAADAERAQVGQWIESIRNDALERERAARRVGEAPGDVVSDAVDRHHRLEVSILVSGAMPFWPPSNVLSAVPNPLKEALPSVAPVARRVEIQAAAGRIRCRRDGFIEMPEMEREWVGCVRPKNIRPARGDPACQYPATMADAAVRSQQPLGRETPRLLAAGNLIAL